MAPKSRKRRPTLGWDQLDLFLVAADVGFTERQAARLGDLSPTSIPPEAVRYLCELSKSSSSPMRVFSVVSAALDLRSRRAESAETLAQRREHRSSGWEYGYQKEVKAGRYRIESDVPLSSDWLPRDAFSTIYADQAWAVATAIEGVNDPAVEEVRVVDISTGTVVWRSTDERYEEGE